MSRRTHFARIGALVAFAVGVTAARAHADDDPKLALAKELFRRGVALYEVGDYEHALAQFRRSHDIFPSSQNAIDIAVCLEKLGRYDEALDAYEEALGITRDEEEVAQIRRAMEINVPRVGTLDVVANVHGVLSVDGRERGMLPLAAPLRVLPGGHRVRVIKDGYRTFDTITVITARVATRVDAVLEPIAPAAAAPERAPEGPGLLARALAMTALEVGVGLGAAMPIGNTLGDRSLSDDFPATFPVIGSVGARIQSFSFGAFAQYGTLFSQRCCVRYADVRLGVEAAYHFPSWRRIDPWLGLAGSYEWMTRPLHFGEYQFGGTPLETYDGGSFGLTSTSGASQTFGGWVASARGGAAYRVSRALAVGPFLDATLGRYTSYSASVTRGIPLQPAANPQGKAFHAWLMIGVRATFDLGPTGAIR